MEDLSRWGLVSFGAGLDAVGTSSTKPSSRNTRVGAMAEI